TGNVMEATDSASRRARASPESVNPSVPIRERIAPARKAAAPGTTSRSDSRSNAGQCMAFIADTRHLRQTGRTEEISFERSRGTPNLQEISRKVARTVPGGR